MSQIDSVRSKSVSLKYQRFTLSGCKDIGIRNLCLLQILSFCTKTFPILIMEISQGKLWYKCIRLGFGTFSLQQDATFLHLRSNNKYKGLQMLNRIFKMEILIFKIIWLTSMQFIGLCCDYYAQLKQEDWACLT